MSEIKKMNIKKYVSGSIESLEDSVVVEKPLNIFINNIYYVSLMCTPSDVKELVLGFLFSEGAVKRPEDIKNIEIKNDDTAFVYLINEYSIERGGRAITSGCGKGSIHISLLNENNIEAIEAKPLINAETILSAMNEFNKMSALFLQTGGVHSCGICGSEGVELISEDIGRHNAVDKLIGKCLLSNVDMKAKALLTTGRISSDILIKAARAKIPVLVSHSAPTDLAVNLARNINMTLIGFARGRRMNIYCGEIE